MSKEKKGLDAVVDTIQTGGIATLPDEAASVPASQEVVTEPTAPEESKQESKKTWQKLAPGELPKVGEKIKCKDGEGKAEKLDGPNVLTRLDTGYAHYGGIDSVLVMR